MYKKIAKLAENGRLSVACAPLASPGDEAMVQTRLDVAVSKLLDETAFVFTWEDSEIRIDRKGFTHYPTILFNEIVEAAGVPLPHERIVVETAVPREGISEPSTFLWYVQRTLNGYFALPFIFHNRTLLYSGVQLLFDRRKRDVHGLPVFAWHCPNSYGDTYDNKEHEDHHLMLLRFFRMLCLPKVEIRESPTGSRLTRTHAREDRPLPAAHRTVRIDPTAFASHSRQLGTGIATHAHPVSTHHRRAHVRRLPSGRAVTVRECVVNKGLNTAHPQHFIC